MKRPWPALVILAVIIAALFLPAVGIHVHSGMGEEAAARFPGQVSLWDLAVKGADCLPTDTYPALSLFDPGRLYLIAGLVLAAAAVLCAFAFRKGSAVPLFVTIAAMVCYATFLVQINNVSGSLLFTILISVQGWVYVPLIAMIAMLAFCLVLLIRRGETGPSDRAFRLAGGVLAICTLLVMLLPVCTIRVSDSLTDSPADAASVRRSVSMATAALGTEENLYELGQKNNAFGHVLSGDLLALESFSSDATNIQGIFLIRGSNTAMNVPVIIAAVLFLLAAVLAFLPRVDRWFPLSASALGALLLLVNGLPLITVGDADMYASASRQLLHLGLGHVTAVPLLAAATGVLSVCAGALGVRRANEPYFVNPLPQGLRLRAVAVALTLASLICLFMPAVTVSFTKPGKNAVQATATLRGTDALSFSAAKQLADPVTSKGKPVYSEDDETYSREAVNTATANMANTFTALTWGALALIAASLVMLLLKKGKKGTLILLLAAAVLRITAWLCATYSLPRAVASAGGELFLYASIPLLIFAAFFTHFADRQELPKKYKLFLMMLPFLLAVFLFAYLPLYGWSYAFFNYKFGLPMDQQEFVGLKWFSEMFTNPANRDNTIRVLKNTLGMSGLNLATSWLPMLFAIFLNEITRTRFKKSVQIFTTLPNFISWALVFSFAMCLFAADTGIYSRLMMDLGLNDPMNPTVWLNSGDHIWLKMWGWSTWKGLGWGAIMYLAAISGIDQELYEAARVDGANRWALMRHITLPGLLPTFFVLLMLSISNILNNGMDQYLVFQNPMNRQTIEVLDLYVYNITIASGGTALYSYATAIGILKTLVSVTLLFTANFLSKKLRGESIM